MPNKQQLSITFNCTNGELIATVMDVNQNIVFERNFGKMTEEEIKRVMSVFKDENPGIDIQMIGVPIN